jgi:peptidoglycan/xylan/chitin deacetylase (PgdA/CDA1 family)
MNTLHVAAAISFLAGIFGYIIARYWVHPIGRYNRQKKCLQKELDHFELMLNQHNLNTWKETRASERLQSARQAVNQMTQVYTSELPYWYKLVLGRRGEIPLNAAAPVLALSNIRHPEHARIRLQQVRRALLLS